MKRGYSSIFDFRILPLGEINEVFKIRGKNGKMMIFQNE